MLDGSPHLSRFALGTAQFGFPYGIANQEGQVTLATAKAMLQLAEANGIDTLDTAIAYGESEACLGEVGTQGFNLVTKLPSMPEGTSNISDWVQKQISLSLLRLGVHSIYGLLLHNPGQLLGNDGKALYRSLQDLKETGKVKKIGVSIYAPDELEMITPQYQFDLIQAPFNLVDHRLYSSGWLKKLKDCGIEIHTRSAFLQGLLLMSKAAIPAKFSPWNNLFDRWHEWLTHQGRSAVQACLAFPLAFPEIDRVVVGAESVGQLEQIISAEGTVINDELPDLCCTDEDLINPSRWSRL